MSLSVGQSNSYQQNRTFNGSSNNAAKSKYFNIPKVDKSSDGKFSVTEATKNLIKGVISPITNMFSSAQNFAVGASMMLATSALIAATGGAVAPLLVITGLSMGVVQGIKAFAEFAKAKNGDDVEKAFYNVGGATSTLGLSMIGARSSLKQASIKTEGLNRLGAIKKCFTSAKQLGLESLDVFKSGYFKTNLRTAIKVLKNPQSLRKYSQELAAEGKENFESSFNALKDILPDEFKGSLKGRSKSQVAIYEKMVKQRTAILAKIKQIKKEAGIPLEVKGQQIKILKERLTNLDTDAKIAKGLVEDSYGARIIESSPQNLRKLVNSLVKAAKEGKIEISEIENYKGVNSKYSGQNSFYFTEKQMTRLAEVSQNAKNIGKNKDSGYTAVHLKVKPKNGKTIELQIRGNAIDNVADWEHIPYDLRQGKDIAKGNNQLGVVLSKAKKAVKLMNKQQKSQYQEYIYDNYIYAQATELGKTAKVPVLPKGVDEILSAESLSILHKQTSSHTPKTIRNPFDVRPQAPIFASAESMLEKSNKKIKSV